MTDVCPTCGIVFLDSGELNQLAPYKDFLTEVENISEPNIQDNYGARKCPECLDHTMDKVNFLNDSGIIIDFCSQCAGIVLDPNELPEIHTTLKSLKEEHPWQNKIMNFMHNVGKE
jgi:Zn-finger nucleic acid-binding protein